MQPNNEVERLCDRPVRLLSCLSAHRLSLARADQSQWPTLRDAGPDARLRPRDGPIIVLSMSEAVLGAVWVRLAFGEVPSMLGLVGGSIVLGSTAAQATIGMRR